MPTSAQLPNWQGRDVLLIGGGPSLKTFDFNQLQGRCTIGCNQSFLLGDKVCQICAFGDIDFWDHYGEKMRGYGGWVATNYPVPNAPPWLKKFKRQDTGLINDGESLAWNNNTGAMIINLALMLGARRVFLLGYDCDQAGSRTHWHDEPLQPQNHLHYEKFRDGFDCIHDSLRSVYPDRQVFNVTDGGSKLMAFPRVHPDQVFLRNAAAA